MMLSIFISQIATAESSIDMERGGYEVDSQQENDSPIYGYTCGEEQKLHVSYHENGKKIHQAKILLNDKSFELTNIVSASGAKCSGGNYIWWSKGETGLLIELSSGDELRCHR
jgi:membrane-bound inhibitor of C-type lysozyme